MVRGQLQGSPVDSTLKGSKKKVTFKLRLDEAESDRKSPEKSMPEWEQRLWSRKGLACVKRPMWLEPSDKNIWSQIMQSPVGLCEKFGFYSTCNGKLLTWLTYYWNYNHTIKKNHSQFRNILGHFTKQHDLVQNKFRRKMSRHFKIWASSIRMDKLAILCLCHVMVAIGSTCC